MMINCLILKCKPKMKLALFFYSRLSCIANCYALPRPRGEQSMPDRPDYLDTGHNQELEEPRQRLLEDLRPCLVSFICKRKKFLRRNFANLKY